MAAKLTYDSTTRREFLSDMVTNISPDETPILSLIGKSKTKDILHNWAEKALRAPGANKAVEGSSLLTAVAKGKSKTRVNNYTQIFRGGYEISASQLAVDEVGGQDEYDEQMLDAMKEVAQDVEYAYIHNAAKVAGDDAVARELGGLQYFIQTNVLANGATPRAFTEDLLNDALEKTWLAGGNVKHIVMSGANKRIASGFTAGNTKNVDAGSKKLIATISVYDSDFGLVSFKASRFMPNDIVFGLDVQHLKTAFLRNFKREELPKTSDSRQGVVIGELTLECRAEKAHFIIKDLATA